MRTRAARFLPDFLLTPGTFRTDPYTYKYRLTFYLPLACPPKLEERRRMGRSASLLRDSAKASRAWRAVARGNSSPPLPYGLRRGSLARYRERRLVGGDIATELKPNPMERSCV